MLKFSNVHTWKYFTTLIIVLLSYLSISAQENSVVKIEPVGKKRFKVSNLRKFPMIIYIDDVIPKGELLVQGDYNKYLRENLKSSSRLRAVFPKEYYDMQMDYFDGVELKYRKKLRFRLMVDSIARRIPITSKSNSPSNDEKDLKTQENLDTFINDLKNSTTNYMDRKAIGVFEWEMKRLNKERNKYTDIFNASSGTGRGYYMEQLKTSFRGLIVSKHLRKTK